MSINTELHHSEDVNSDSENESSEEDVDSFTEEISDSKDRKEKLELEVFRNQASGHSKLFVIGKEKIAKPCNPNEKLIYEALSTDDIIGPFTPKYHGTIEHQIPKFEVRHFQRSNQFIVLENLTASYSHACIIDLKLGQRPYTPKLHSEKKIIQRKVKASGTTTAKLGFRLSGIRVYIPSKDIYIVKRSRYGNRLSDKTLTRSVELFLNDGLRIRSELIPLFISQLESLLNALTKQDRFDFMASSVLLIYEGNYSKTSTPTKTDVRLIDFDHARLKSEDDVDDESGIKVGISSLIFILRRLQLAAKRSHSLEDLNYIENNNFIQKTGFLTISSPSSDFPS
eukprot:TRINITY_DN15144_c0_g1_i1.p1 TRINITY_DN15144_c0_g1~~TRINITY_DN15144_c0_g1_i1.p1  ORF type:complete len:340 (+),score=30.13 TRINITY_DN15144_c0_g1_i1:90-1109(+)